MHLEGASRGASSLAVKTGSMLPWPSLPRRAGGDEPLTVSVGDVEGEPGLGSTFVTGAAVAASGGAAAAGGAVATADAGGTAAAAGGASGPAGGRAALLLPPPRERGEAGRGGRPESGPGGPGGLPGSGERDGGP
jgi:hypothetical protein